MLSIVKNMHIYISLFIVFIGDQCSSASLGHDDIDIVDTKAKSDKREVEGRVITGDAYEYIVRYYQECWM